MSSQAIEDKSRNPEVPPIWSKVLDILAVPRPYYNLVSITRPTDSNKANKPDDIRKLKLRVKILHSVRISTILGIENKNTIMEIFRFKNNNQKILPFKRQQKSKSIRAERIKTTQTFWRTSACASFENHGIMHSSVTCSPKQ